MAMWLVLFLLLPAIILWGFAMLALIEHLFAKLNAALRHVHQDDDHYTPWWESRLR